MTRSGNSRLPVGVEYSEIPRRCVAGTAERNYLFGGGGLSFK